MGKVEERKQYFIEGIRERQAFSQRDQEIRCLMERKLEELK